MPYEKLVENPTIINLDELGPNGIELHYSRSGGELNVSLKDAVGANAYEITLKITPAGNVFMASGTIRSSMDLVCSLCAIDLKHPVNENFNEVLIVAGRKERTAQSAKVNHSSELHFDGPNCTELASAHFNVGDFLYELIAISEPIKPLGRPDCDSTCENYQEALSKGWLSNENQGDFKRENAFAALKGIKLNG